MNHRVQSNHTSEGLKSQCGAAWLGHLLPALKRLDSLLERAVVKAESAYGAQAANDPYRGLYVSAEEVQRVLTRQPGEPLLYVDHDRSEQNADSGIEDHNGNDSTLAWLRTAFDLSSFDMDVVLIALAPELDLRYERLYAYLQDDVTRRRPTVDLALNLLCSSAHERLMRRAHFCSDAALIRHGLIDVIPDPNQVQPPLLSHYLTLDDQIVKFLLGFQSLDARTASFSRLVQPSVRLEDLHLDSAVKRGLLNLVGKAQEALRPLRLYFHGPRGVGKRQTAEAIAGQLNAPLLAIDLSAALNSAHSFEKALPLVFREAWLLNCVLYLEGMDDLRSNERSTELKRLLDALSQTVNVTILGGENPLPPEGSDPLEITSVAFADPDFGQRRDCWLSCLTRADVALHERDLDLLAGRFRLTPRQIAEAVASAGSCAQWNSAATSADRLPFERETKSNLGDLFSAARSQCGHELAGLCRKIDPLYCWDDIVLPQDTMSQLRDICDRVIYRRRVMSEWGFERKLSLGKGVNALFSGPSGTGKTMAAEIIANELGLDLYKIDLSSVVSKYIGETEKNLDRIFRAAENANGILFFDEADALFGKRSQVKDAHDRYANIEISYLLQKMEEYEGLTILATNLRKNMDDAFVRRMAFTVNFPFPEEEYRLRIWGKIWPAETPRADDLNLHFLAKQFKLSGGNIKNIALAAAFQAAADGQIVSMEQLIQGTKRELQKQGKTVVEKDFGEYAKLMRMQ